MSDENKQADGEAAPLVLVTGASGYIASNVVKALLDSNKYRVRGTVRSVDKWTKLLSSLKEDDHKHELELVSADLTKDAGWDEAVAGCTYVLHMASPFPLGVPKDPMEVIGPAVSGVEKVFGAAIRGKSVKRIVLTSSCASIYPGNFAKMDAGELFTEKDWTDEEKTDPYCVSKTRAEKRAWKLIEEQPAERGLECVVVNPSLVFGPVQNNRMSSSSKIIKMMLLKEQPLLPGTFVACVDVREVVSAHLAALEKPDAKGNRFICSSETIRFADISKILADEFGKQGYPSTPAKVAWDCVLKLGAVFDRQLKYQIVPMLGKKMLMDHTKAESELGIKFRPVKESLIDMAYSMIEHGQVPDKRTK